MRSRSELRFHRCPVHGQLKPTQVDGADLCRKRVGGEPCGQPAPRVGDYVMADRDRKCYIEYLANLATLYDLEKERLGVKAGPKELHQHAHLTQNFHIPREVFESLTEEQKDKILASAKTHREKALPHV